MSSGEAILVEDRELIDCCLPVIEHALGMQENRRASRRLIRIPEKISLCVATVYGA